MNPPNKIIQASKIGMIDNKTPAKLDFIAFTKPKLWQVINIGENQVAMRIGMAKIINFMITKLYIMLYKSCKMLLPTHVCNGKFLDFLGFSEKRSKKNLFFPRTKT